MRVAASRGECLESGEGLNTRESQYKPQPFLQLRTDSQSEAVAIQAIRNAKGNSICVDCGAPSERKGAVEGSGRECGSLGLGKPGAPMLPAPQGS